MYRSARKIVEAVREKEVTAEEIAKYFLSKIEENKDLGSFISINENILEEAKALDKKTKEGYEPGPLAGLPIAIKDNIMTKDILTTCGSKALENFISPYDATVIKRIKEADGFILGKTNMDEFAMGASSETSYFGVTKNPLDPERIAGGSSSGSASAVASGEAPIALGSDTGGSIRQPASYCSIYGYYPSYGTFSRYGLASMANSLDQIGILANNIEDINLLSQVLSGPDKKDATSNPVKKEFILNPGEDLKGKKFALPKSIKNFKLEDEIKEGFEKGLDLLKELGGEIVEVDFDLLRYATPVYNIVVATEVSSGMSRYDGIIFGDRTEEYTDNRELFVNTRTEVFGEEVKRRIAMGTYYATGEQKLYKKASLVRKKLRNTYDEIFKEYDAIITPTTNDLPYRFDSERGEDPLSMYDSEMFTVSANLCGLNAISIPLNKGLGASLMLTGKRDADEDILNIAAIVERGL